jgi:adenine/guanine phosphoribosyltransferase-like PRPP-binding protein
MDREELTTHLLAGGIPPEHLTGDTDSIAPYCGLFDPPGAEALGRALAEKVHQLQPTKVLVWEDSDVNILGHIVARELGTTAARALEVSGVLDLDGTIGADRVVVVADAIRRTSHALAMQALAERNGGQLVGYAVLVSTPALRAATEGATTIVLLQGEDEQALR